MALSNNNKDIFDEDARASESLPFSNQMQQAILGHLLWNKHEEIARDSKDGVTPDEKTRVARDKRHELCQSFFLQCRDRVTPEWFAEPFCQILWKAAKLYAQRHEGTRPSPSEVMTDEDIEKETMERKNKLRTMLGTCFEQANLFALEQLTDELTGWLKSQFFRKGFHESRDLYNRKQPFQAYAAIEKAVGEIKTANFRSEKIWTFDDPAGIVEKRETNVSNALTWGLSMFDRLLLPEGKGRGCLLPGTTTTLVGPVNAGKTTVMMTVVCANLRQGRKVLYMPHEGSPEELQAKFLCCMLDQNLDWLTTNAKIFRRDSSTWNEEERQNAKLIYRAQKQLRTLTFHPMIRQGLTVEEVCSSIRIKNDEVAKRDGIGYHMVVSDYPAKLDTEKARYGKLEHRHKIEEIYMSLNRLAEEVGFHQLNGAQVNREGNKINKGMKGFEKRLLEMEDFAEAFGPMADTATVITINCDAIAELQNRVTLHCAKSRTSAKGWSVVCRSRYKNSISHQEVRDPVTGEWISDATFYYGSATGTALMNQVLDKFRNQQVEKNEVI